MAINRNEMITCLSKMGYSETFLETKTDFQLRETIECFGLLSGLSG